MQQLRPVVTLAAALLFATFARAAEIKPPSAGHSSPDNASVYLKQPGCMRWTDECITCTRAGKNEAPICSNIGIACQPKAIRCIEAGAATDKPAAK
jgi:hypothetical protein